MTYNLTQLAASDTVFKLVTFANDSTGGLLMGLFVLAAFFIMLMAFKRYEFSKALLTSSSISLIVSLLLVYAKLINPMWALLFAILTAGSALFSALFQ